MSEKELMNENAEILEEEKTVSRNFIEQIIDKDLSEGVYEGVHTRFPPEPNGSRRLVAGAFNRQYKNILMFHILSFIQPYRNRLSLLPVSSHKFSSGPDHLSAASKPH